VSSTNHEVPQYAVFTMPVTSSLLGPHIFHSTLCLTLHTTWQTQTKQHTTLQSCTFWTTLLLHITMLQLSIALSYTACVSELLTIFAGCPSLIFTAGPNQKEGYRVDSQLIYRSPIPIYWTLALHTYIYIYIYTHTHRVSQVNKLQNITI